MEWLTSIAEQYGLFVALVVYVIYDSKQRETRYINTIDSLAENFNIVTVIRNDVDEIKADMKVMNRR